MKQKAICIIFLIIIFLYSSCNNTNDITVNISDEGLVSPTEISSGIAPSTEAIKWNVIESESVDLNVDGENEDIKLYSCNDEKQNYKIRIRDSEYIFEFDSSNVTDVRAIKIIKFICLGNGYQGLLLGISSESEIPTDQTTPPYWSDYSFIVVGYCFWYNENQAFRNLKNPA